MHELFLSLREWLEKTNIHGVEFCYAGNEGAIVERHSGSLKAFCERQFFGFVGVEDLARLQASATVNVYVHRGAGFFHHKVLELITARRPILSYPCETPETTRLASDAGCTLFSCKNRLEIMTAMNEIAAGNVPPAAPGLLSQFSWGARSKSLEQILYKAGRESL